MSIRTYNYKMGFKVNNHSIPDPAVFTGKASALDSSGSRDANGLLHRKMVATKHPLKIEYHNIDWKMARKIMGYMTGESFNFTFPDPLDGIITIKAYVGDRDWSVALAYDAEEDSDYMDQYVGDLKFSVIEY